ncbi:hypothetical protein DA966_21320 [Salmonella enterica]|nr:hypothetical protein [Salmonella enterica]
MPDNGVKAVPHLKHRCACKPDERSAIRQIRTKWWGRFAGLMNVTSSGGITKLLRQRRFVINIG